MWSVMTIEHLHVCMYSGQMWGDNAGMKANQMKISANMYKKSLTKYTSRHLDNHCAVVKNGASDIDWSQVITQCEFCLVMSSGDQSTHANCRSNKECCCQRWEPLFVWDESSELPSGNRVPEVLFYGLQCNNVSADP